jgi:hypothetical protein
VPVCRLSGVQPATINNAAVRPKPFNKRVILGVIRVITDRCLEVGIWTLIVAVVVVVGCCPFLFPWPNGLYLDYII